MESKKIREFQFFFREQIVVMLYHRQYIAFHAHGNANRRALKNFSQDIRASKEMDLNRIYYLARLHGVPSMSVSSASIAKYRQLPLF